MSIFLIFVSNIETFYEILININQLYNLNLKIVIKKVCNGRRGYNVFFSIDNDFLNNFVKCL